MSVGYWLWGAVVVVPVFALGLLMFFITRRYETTHAQRSPEEKEASAAVTRENYRDPVAQK